MTDLEMTKLCAQAMGYGLIFRNSEEGWLMLKTMPDATEARHFDPLNDDREAMALVKKFLLSIDGPITEHREWGVTDQYGDCVTNDDLNRAIVECVAELQTVRPA